MPDIENLNAFVASLEKENPSPEQLLAIISIESRSPMSAIQGYAQILKQTLESENLKSLDEISTWIDRLIENTTYLDRLLDLARRQNNRSP